jgi:hypothetical protein
MLTALTILTILTGLRGVLYMTAITCATLVALKADDQHRRSDARKVLALLLTPITKARRPCVPVSTNLPVTPTPVLPAGPPPQPQSPGPSA